MTGVTVRGELDRLNDRMFIQENRVWVFLMCIKWLSITTIFKEATENNDNLKS